VLNRIKAGTTMYNFFICRYIGKSKSRIAKEGLKSLA